MTEAGDREPAEKIEIAVAVGVVQVRAVPARERDRQASVHIDHVPMREFDYLGVVHRALPAALRAVSRQRRHFRAALHHFGADSGAGEDFEQHRMLVAAVDYVRLRDALVQRLDAAFDLRNHPFVDHAARDQPPRFGRVERREQLAVLILHAFDVAQQDQFFRLERGRDLARRRVGIDVVSLAVAPEPGRRDHRDKIVHLERPQQLRIHAIDFADQPDIDPRALAVVAGHDHPHLARPDQVAVLAREPDRAAAHARNRRDEVLVDSLQHHLGRFHRRRIGHPHPAHETRLEPELADQFRDLRPAAVHDDRVDADQVEQHDLLRKTLAQLLGLHRMPAVLDDERLAAKAPNIRQRLDQHVSPIVDSLFHALRNLTNLSLKKEIKTVLRAPRNPSSARPLITV